MTSSGTLTALRTCVIPGPIYYTESLSAAAIATSYKGAYAYDRYIIMKKYIFQNLSVVIFRRHLPVIISAKKQRKLEDFLRFTIYHIKNGGA